MDKHITFLPYHLKELYKTKIFLNNLYMNHGLKQNKIAQKYIHVGSQSVLYRQCTSNNKDTKNVHCDMFGKVS